MCRPKEFFYNEILQGEGRDYISDLPCYARRYNTIDVLDKEEIVNYIEAARKFTIEEYEGRLNIFSVTEQDEDFTSWLIVARQVGMVVIETPSRQGPYNCWMLLDKF
jgi:phosphosulfolactate synthase (CoM biosynthesis protein A)